ncbi:hypothetical protein FK216_08985 [Moraxellaceae bacterium AER2_44_116]|jgi:hypothetical protein|nr:hypothetical protein [Moraxellaceae bacterium]TQC97402.1 hypothetical protein FK216_08985 [Moraxellaceae bacterium AER2_44_116]
MFSRDHLIIGAVGFVLGGVVATASITAVLMTQSHEEKTCPPVTAIIAPAPQTMNQGQATTPPPPPPVSEPTPTPVAVATPEPVKSAPPTALKPVPTKKLNSLEAEEADRLTEEQKQLLARKNNLHSQVNDSAEIIRLKEQQIKEMEAKLKQ